MGVSAGQVPETMFPQISGWFQIQDIQDISKHDINTVQLCGTIGWCPTKMAATAIFLLKAWDIALVDVIGRFLRICDPLLQVPTLCFASSVESNAILAHLS
jgi:hypothetical protein